MNTAQSHPHQTTPGTQFSSTAGQSLTELALVMPLLLIIMAAIFDVGRGLQTYVVLLNASREAAVTGAAAETDTNSLRLLVLEELARGNVDSSRAEVTIEYRQQGFPEATHIVVRIDYSLPLIMSVLRMPAIDMQATTEMVTFW